MVAGPIVTTHPAPKCKMDKEAEALLETHDATVLGNAMALVAKVSTLTVTAIRSLGISTSTGVAMSECTTGTELAAVRKAIVEALMLADTKALVKLGKNCPAGTSKKEAATLIVSRLLTAVSGAGGTLVPAPGGGQQTGTLHVVSEKAEDMADTMTGYETKELEKQLKKLKGMFNVRWRSHRLCKFSSFKKVAHFYFNEHSFPEPSRFPFVQDAAHAKGRRVYLVLPSAPQCLRRCSGRGGRSRSA